MHIQINEGEGMGTLYRRWTLMRIWIIRVALAVSVMVTLPAFANDDGTPQPRFQSADVFALPLAGPLELTGAATLVRSQHALHARVMTKVAEAGKAYTLWWVIFNNPAACIDGCDPADLGNPAVRGAVFYGTGAISASDGGMGGVLNVDFTTQAARIPKGTFRLDDVLVDMGLDRVFNTNGLNRNRGFRAEVHLVVDLHSGPMPGDSWVADLTTTDFPGIPTLGASNHRAAVFAPIR